MAGDLETLIDMGFPQDRAELAVKATGGLQGAIDWLEKNQEKSIDEIKADQAGATASDEAPSLQPGEEARSLVCEDCGRKLRSTAQAEWHASKTGSRELCRVDRRNRTSHGRREEAEAR